MQAQSKPTIQPISADTAGRVAGARWAWRRAQEEQIQRLLAARERLVDTLDSQSPGIGAVMMAKLLEPGTVTTDEDAYRLWSDELVPGIYQLVVADPAFVAAFAFGALAVLDPAPDRLEVNWDD
jgi:hypothetical protein